MPTPPRKLTLTPTFDEQPAPQATFTRLASATLRRVEAVFVQRGAEYGDSWADNTWVTTLAVAKKLGVNLRKEHCRAIALAAFVDAKYTRNIGGYKDDSLMDGINYTAALAEEMRESGQA